MKKWTLINEKKPSGNDITDFYKIDKEIAQIMINRGIETEEQIKMYANPDLRWLRDPFLLKDMDLAYERIMTAIAKKEKICIYGDYDVDGVSSTSILKIFFRNIGYDVNYYIPNRLEEGYGLNKEAILAVKEMGTDLMITVDCGITSVEEVDYANSLGLDVIITDHHECQSELPNAYAVVNPKREDCSYPFKGICGCSVALKLIHALSGDGFFEDIYDYLEIVSLATICDVMPVLDENRIIVKNGLEIMGKGKNIGMKALIEVCGLENAEIRSSHLGFQIGPRINASGRLGFSTLGVELFTCEDEQMAKEIAEVMNMKNEERQLIESDMYKEVEEKIYSCGYEDSKVFVVSGKNWHHGIIGIVASKITEKFYKPCILLCEEGEYATGSARSIQGFDIFKAMYECRELMTKFGGHEQAAGLTIAIDNIDELREKINDIADYKLEKEDLIEEVKVEYEIDVDKITLDLVDKLHILEPFGIKNPTPYFLLRNCFVKNAYKIGKDKNHLKLNLVKDIEIECIGFSMAYLLDKFNVNDFIDIVFQIDKNTFRDVTKVQLLIKDIRLNKPNQVGKFPLLASEIEDLLSLDNLNLIRYGINSQKEQEEFFEDNKEKIEINKDEEGYIDYIENIISRLEDGDLIVVNTLNGYFRAISDLYTAQDKKIDLIFLSNIDKTDIKVYNKIIMYDYFDNNLEMSYILDEKNNNCELLLNFSYTDFSYIKNKCREMEFIRDDFVRTYKYILYIEKNQKEMMNNFAKNDKIEIGLKNIIDYRLFLNECKLSPMKAYIILKVLSNEVLIDYYIDYNDGLIYYNILPKPDKKLNLQENEIVIFLDSKKIN